MISDSDLLFVDFETASTADLKQHGARRHVAGGYPIALAYSLGGLSVPALCWHNHGKPLDPSKMPEMIRAALGQGRKLAAWNAGFDRTVWNGWGPYLPPERWIDVAVQAMSSNLPGDLDGSAKRLTGYGKDKEGRKLIKRYCILREDPALDPAAWQRFINYALRDVEAMRSVYQMTRPLPDEEWRAYWASEAINDRGIGIDLKLVEKAERMAGIDARLAGNELFKLTDGQIGSITLIGQITAWVHNHLSTNYPEASKILETPIEEDDEEEADEEGRPLTHKLSLTRKHIDLLLPMLRLANDPALADIIRVLELRQYGGGAAPKKFARMLAQQDGGRLYQQFSFNGAGQTGRFSGRGVQLQNLTRDHLGPESEPEFIERLIDGAPHGELAEMGAGEPVSRKLALIVRPSLIAKPGHLFVWSDWSQIEARVLPWLSNSRGGERKLALFRAIDADPSRPDIYMESAGGMLHKPPEAITKSERQRGKIAELALGFNGGKGALSRMAANYGMHFSEEEAQEIVNQWRAANAWAPSFWSSLYGAAVEAIASPDTIRRAGRVAFLFRRNYLRGTLFMGLPSGRLLCYPSLRWLEREDEPGRFDWTFRRQRGRIKIWPGLFAENATQATAADVLRGTLVRLESDGLVPGEVVAHVHDEVILEVPEECAMRAKDWLGLTMVEGFPWSAGLPLTSHETVAEYYSKAIE